MVSLRFTVATVLAGGAAGISVDFALFPIDSIKTRLQASSQGVDFMKSAEKVNKYRGFFSSMIASFPSSATFWLTYEVSKQYIPVENVNLNSFLAASIAESAQALIRNPFEVVKQN